MRSVSLAILVVVLLVLGVGLYAFNRGDEHQPEEPPNVDAAGEQLKLSLGETGALHDVELTPLAVVEDSRCPIDAQCVQAGTVRVQTKVASGLGISTTVLELNQPLTTEAEEVTLIEVTPERKLGATPSPDAYEFAFRVIKRNISY